MHTTSTPTHTPTLYGYVRVSTHDQCIDRQIDEILKHGVTRENIYIDRASGKDFNRSQYQTMMGIVKRGDTIVVHSLDRLGRSFADVPEEYNRLVRKEGVHIRVLGMDALNSEKATDRTSIFMQQLWLMVQSFFAENERIVMLERQHAAYVAAKARGRKFGRPELPLPHNFMEWVEKWVGGLVSHREAARQCNMNPSTFLRRAKLAVND